MTLANNHSRFVKPGHVDKNGWLYMGLSQTTGTKLWLFLENAGDMTHDDATKHLRKIKDFHGHRGSKQQTVEDLQHSSKDDGGVRRFTKEEGEQINQFLEEQPEWDKKLIDAFGNEEEAIWLQTASTQKLKRHELACFQELFTGEQCAYGKKFNIASLLLVRSEPRPR